MPQQQMAGIEGAFAIGTHKFKSQRWNASIVRDVNDATGFGDIFRTNIGGLQVLRGSADGFLFSDAASTAPDAVLATSSYIGVTFTLTATGSTRGTCSYNGTAIVSMVGVGTGVNGNGVASISFVSTGVVNEVWDQA